MIPQSVYLLCGLYLFLGLEQVISTPPFTYPSVDCGIAQAYILDLKERIESLQQSQSERENSQLRKTVEDLRTTISDFIANTVNRQKIDDEKLQKQVEEKAKSQTEIENLKKEIKKLNENLDNFQRISAIDKEERIGERVRNSNHNIQHILRDKKDEIETEEATIRQFQIVLILKIENEILKENLARQKASLDEANNELETKKKELEENQAKEKNLNNEIQELNSEVASLKKKVEESQTQLTGSNHLVERTPKTDCKGLSSGIYDIQISNLNPISVLCEGNIEGGGWIVIHKRFNGSVDFKRSWTEYRNGFGNMTGEFFIGLENLHRITSSRTYELYVQLRFYNGRVKFASYDYFRIANEDSKYELELLGEFRGTEENALVKNLNQAFTTFDQDNDQADGKNCAEKFGAWWHESCGEVGLNAKYFKSGFGDCTSMHWYNCIPLKSVQMLIRTK